jgi:hypothetical protein
MRKIKLLVCIVGLPISTIWNVHSQTFKAFKATISTGVAIPTGSGGKANYITAFEGQYAFNDRIAVGLRSESALMKRGEGDYVQSFFNKSSYTNVLAITGDYYLSAKKIRPFIGLDAGLAILNKAETNTTTGIRLYNEKKLVIAPVAGLETWHFRTSIEYNIIEKSELTENSYLNIKAGFFLGGGKRKK